MLQGIKYSIFSIFAYSAMCILSGCSKKLSSKSHLKDDTRSISLQDAFFRHMDIPVPLRFTIQKHQQEQGSCGPVESIECFGPLTSAQTVSFYNRAMEAAGWEIVDLSSEHAGFLYCSKPTKMCGIQVSNNDNQTDRNAATNVKIFITTPTGS